MPRLNHTPGHHPLQDIQMPFLHALLDTFGHVPVVGFRLFIVRNDLVIAVFAGKKIGNSQYGCKNCDEQTSV
jgi:hypothetical protein